MKYDPGSIAQQFVILTDRILNHQKVVTAASKYIFHCDDRKVKCMYVIGQHSAMTSSVL